MRPLFGVAFASALVLSLSSVAAAETRGQVQGFGGFTFGDTVTASTFGGNVAVGLTENIQVIGEAGRMSDIKPSLLGTIFDFSPVDLRVSAWYGEGGVRFITSPGSAIRPYAEATAGFAHLTTGIDGFGGPAYAAAEAALGFLDRTEPMLGVGGGVIVQGGPVVLDLGYRYKKIMADGSVQSLINGGDPFDVNQMRIGFGVRF